jgi:hypothetical protein
MSRNEARRLFKESLALIDQFGSALFGAAEADVLGLDEAHERKKAEKIIVAATDRIQALVNMGNTTTALAGEVQDATKKAREDPFGIGYVVDDNEECEIFIHEEVLRTLVSRIGAVYGFDEEEHRKGLDRPQSHLLAICEQIGVSIRHLLAKKMISIPSCEHEIKHILFAIVKASFPDAVPDGGVTFHGLTGSKPDLGVPRLKTCIETKVARSISDLSRVIGEILTDQSTYGSSDYTNFVAVIYTDNDEITDNLLCDEETRRRDLLGHEPRFKWNCVLARGPLARKP